MAGPPKHKFRIDELLWDDDYVVEKLWKKHRVDTWEVEDVALDDPDVEFWWASDRKHGSRLMGIGVTRGGRRLL